MDSSSRGASGVARRYEWGERIGRLAEKFAIARRLLDLNVAQDIIVGTTGLSENEVLKIASNEEVCTMSNVVDNAVKGAVEHCIEKGILADFLADNYEEACRMLIDEFEAEEAERIMRYEERQAGRVEEHLKAARKLLDLGIPMDIVTRSIGIPLDEARHLEPGQMRGSV